MTPVRSVVALVFHGEVELGGAGLPALAKLVGGDVVVLLATRVQRGDLCRAGGVLATMLKLGFDLVASAAERAAHRGGNAVDLGHTVADRCPFDPEAARELQAQLGLVEEAAGAGVGVRMPASRRVPGASGGRTTRPGGCSPEAPSVS